MLCEPTRLQDRALLLKRVMRRDPQTFVFLVAQLIRALQQSRALAFTRDFRAVEVQQDAALQQRLRHLRIRT